MAHKTSVFFLVLCLLCILPNLHAEEIGRNTTAASPRNSSPAPAGLDPVAVQKIVFETSALLVRTSGKVTSFSSFRLSKPARLVIDLPGVANQLGGQVFSGDTAPVSSVRAVAYNDKLRLIIEASATPAFPDTRIESTPAGLVINILESSASAVLSPAPAQAVPDKPAKAELSQLKPSTAGAVTSRGHVASVAVEQKQDAARVTLNISGNCPISDPVEVLNGISVSLGDCIVPANWQDNVDAVKENSVVKAVTLFPSDRTRKVEAGVLIELRQKSKFGYSKDRQRLAIDLTAAAGSASSEDKPFKLATARKDVNTVAKTFTGKRVSMEFDNADLRQIFRLLGEVSGDNIIIGDDVKGTYTIKLKEVAWDQALDMITKNNNLVVAQLDNVIEIMTRAKKSERDRIDDEERQKESQRQREIEAASQAKEGKLTCTVQLMHAPATRVINQLTSFLTYGAGGARARHDPASSGASGASSVGATNVSSGQSSSLYADANTNKLLIQDYRQSVCSVVKLAKKFDVPDKQVMIESRIVLANLDFARSIGVNWDTHYRDGSASILGINQIDSGFGGVVSNPQTAPGSTAAGMLTGVSFGSIASNIQLGMRLQAAESASMVKVISSPKVVTSYGEPATITQGSQIPYPGVDKNGQPIVEMKDATLELDVTPTITPGCDVLMDIKLKNDSPGVPINNLTPIDKRSVKTKITVKSGDTAVIGGVMVKQENEGDTGVPFLMKVPLLGNLFKTNEKKTFQRELLIFITPKLLNRSCTEDYTDSSAEKNFTKVECLPNNEELKCDDVKLPLIEPYNPPKVHKFL